MCFEERLISAMTRPPARSVTHTCVVWRSVNWRPRRFVWPDIRAPKTKLATYAIRPMVARIKMKLRRWEESGAILFIISSSIAERKDVPVAIVGLRIDERT
jgi:hypothetical protein